MAANCCLLLLCAVVGLCGVTGEGLHLREGEACVSNGARGTCVPLFKCTTAAITQTYLEAGFGNSCPGGECFPAAPALCSSERGQRVVCCTDCYLAQGEGVKNFAVGPLGIEVSTAGKPVAFTKCYEYFKRLPYPCRGKANVRLRRIWNETSQCHDFTLVVALAVGGRDAQRWEFPHMALLGFGEEAASAQWLCGGAIVSERFILTAAHCTATRALGSVKFAALGLLKRSDPPDTWKVHNIKRIITHPQYSEPSKYHDIALLETDTEIMFGADLLPACLDLGSRPAQIFAEASGWGRLGPQQALADNLQVVSLVEYDKAECEELFPEHRHLKRGYDHETQMCYGSRAKIADTCDGDSGGPLQTNKFRCLYTVVGVTSFGRACGEADAAGVYTRVAHYVPWIESIVWPNETDHDD